jgi:hypothetical protein
MRDAIFVINNDCGRRYECDSRINETLGFKSYADTEKSNSSSQTAGHLNCNTLNTRHHELENFREIFLKKKIPRKL